jgi:glycine cleavage system H protein
MIPDDRRYNRSHVWAMQVGELLEIGVTEPILKKISPLISVEFPEVDDDVKVELGFGELEGSEETHQLYPPIESRVIEANAELIWNHQKLLKDPYGEGWLLKLAMRDEEKVEALMDAQEYREFCAEDLGEKFAK